MTLDVSMLFNMLLKTDWFKEIREFMGITVSNYVNMDVEVNNNSSLDNRIVPT